MTREEAIKYLNTLYMALAVFPNQQISLGNADKMKESVDMAIKALEQEPCKDAISRQAVDELSKELVHTTKDKADFLCNFWEGLQKLPSVTPQPKMGRWINAYPDKEPNPMFMYGTCSMCGFEQAISNKLNFCPNCGAKMIKEVKE